MFIPGFLIQVIYGVSMVKVLAQWRAILVLFLKGTLLILAIEERGSIAPG